MRDSASPRDEDRPDYIIDYDNDDRHQQSTRDPPPVHQIVLDPDYDTLHLTCSNPSSPPPSRVLVSAGILLGGGSLGGSFDDRPTFYDHDGSDGSTYSNFDDASSNSHNHNIPPSYDDTEWASSAAGVFASASKLGNNNNGTSLLEYYGSRAQQLHHANKEPAAHNNTRNKTDRQDEERPPSTPTSTNERALPKRRIMEEPLRFFRLALLSHFFYVSGSALLLWYTLGPLYQLYVVTDDDTGSDIRWKGVPLHLVEMGIDTWLSQPQLLLGSAMFAFLQLGIIDFVRTLQLFHLAQILAGMIGLVAAMIYHAHRRISQWFYLLLFAYTMLCQATCLWYHHYDTLVVAARAQADTATTPDPTQTTDSSTGECRRRSKRQRKRTTNTKCKTGHFAFHDGLSQTPSGLVPSDRSYGSSSGSTPRSNGEEAAGCCRHADGSHHQKQPSSSSSSQDFCIDNSFSFEHQPDDVIEETGKRSRETFSETDQLPSPRNATNRKTNKQQPKPSSVSSSRQSKARHNDTRGCGRFLANHYGHLLCYGADSLMVLGAVWQLVVSHWEFFVYGHDGLIDVTLPTELLDGEENMPPLLNDTSFTGQALLIARIVPPSLWLLSAVMQSILTPTLYWHQQQLRRRRQKSQKCSRKRPIKASNNDQPTTTPARRTATSLASSPSRRR